LHVSVLLKEAIDGLAVRNGGTYVDATFGAGGHTRAILERLGPRGRVVAFDTDASVHTRTDLPDDSRLLLIHANFRTLEAELTHRSLTPVDGVLFDLGVSSMQFDVGERGFSLSASASDAALDMRMNQSEGFTAAEYIERTSESELADVIFKFGEERKSRRIARLIKQHHPQTTGELARIVSGAVHQPGKRERIHPATRTFQALRIAVNDELAALEEGLDAAINVLRPGGRLVAIAFHSLEDRIVKNKFRSDDRLNPITRKPMGASDEELARNPRSRSAKLRVAERIT
jgi:16S rRNA (cytosine1402-N4)-methyltransferase